VVTTSFPCARARFHRGVRLDDLVEGVEVVDRDDRLAGLDAVEVFL